MMKRLVTLLPLLLLGAWTTTADAQDSLIPKQLAGPPDEFAAMRAPDPAQAAVISRSALLPVTFAARSSRTTLTIPVEGERLSFALLDNGAGWQAQMRDANGHRVAPQRLAAGARGVSLTPDNPSPALQGSGYAIEGTRAGSWTLDIRAPRADTRGFVLLEGDARTELASYPVHRANQVGNRLAFAATLANNSSAAGPLLGSGAGRVTRAQLLITLPDGRQTAAAMVDDGHHEDGDAADGVYAGGFSPDAPGNYVVQVLVQGIDRQGHAFVRTAEHVVPVVAPSLALNGDAVRAVSGADGRLQLRIPVRQTRQQARDTGIRHYRLFAEVWGRDGNGRALPVAWVGGMVAPEGGMLPVGLDRRWIQRVGARAPFELRNLRIEDPDVHVTVASGDRMPLQLPAIAMLDAQARRTLLIDDVMRMGPRPSAMRSTALANGPQLLLVHGFCSSGTPWPQAQFANASVFSDPGQNRSNDLFARLLQAFGSQWTSFGTVAHSQGGMAALHLYSYYWSGLDNASGNRLLQSLGTPYQGTNLAGIIARVGSWFGISCGSNYDLTYDGARAWLAGIPASARAKTHYYTTSFKKTHWWVNDYCDFFADLVLSDPEDGTVEQVNAQLPGGVNHGHVLGQCHIAGMRDPAQYSDAGRNAEMSANAAR